MSIFFRNKRSDLTDITVILDRSGSMAGRADETIGGFNAFVEEQKEVEGDARLTLIQFDHEYQIDYEGVDINDVEPLNRDTYVPRGWTALLDAIGQGIAAARARMKTYRDEPNNVLLVIITDGEENYSREFKAEVIKNNIALLEQEDNWTFVFMGADQDAFLSAKDYGFAPEKTMSYSGSGQGIFTAFAAMSCGVTNARTGTMGAANEEAFFSPEDYKQQADLGVLNPQISISNNNQ